MTVAAGTKLGPYEVIAPLGSGGMGEVYRARDTRLDREVAIKVLRANLSSDNSLKQRLEREARAVSKLSHPHICTLHDIGHQDGVDFLVMEYLDGETLEQRLLRGPLQPEQTLRYAVQIADALAKAHKLGITHRDLKPANVMLTKSGAKLMDFGLAKQSEVAPLAAALTEMTQAQLTQAQLMDHAKLTSEGMIVGTFQYMAPEQLEGKEADARTDIFAFGELIHEMVTGKPAFSGKSRASLIAAILTADPPPMTQLQPITPLALEHVVKKCLAKDPDDRWQSASDLASELSWILAAGGSQAGAAARPQVSPRKRRDRALWIGAGLLLVPLVAYLGWQIGRRENNSSPVHLTVALPAGKALFSNSSEPLAISPDGSMIVYSAAGEDRKAQLYLRKLGDFESTPIAGTEAGWSPFFSPNGESLAFVSGEGKLKKVLLRGGSPVVLADQAVLSGAWGDDDTIYYNKTFSSGLYAVPAGGGQPKQVTKPGSTPEDRAHVWPNVLPGGNDLVFTAWTGRSFNDARIEALSLKSGKRKVLIEGGTGARYLSSGRLAYTRNGTMFIVGFDPKGLEVKGTPVPVVDGVNTGTSNGDADFAVSNDGTLAFQPGTFSSFQRNLVWMDRSGKATNVTPEVKPYGYPSASSDGKKIALTLEGSSYDIWVYDVERDTFTKASFGGDDYRPHLASDGKMLGYDSSKSGHQQIYVKHGIAQGDETAVTDGPEDKEFCGFTPDGREVIFARQNKDTGWDLYAAAVDGDHKPRPLVVGPFNQRGARISPDGKWLAYVSDESGQHEIFVQAMNDASLRAQVSSEGGDGPRWAPSSNELLFLAKNRVMSAKFSSVGGLNPSKPALLFEERGWTDFDVAADGRLLVTRDADSNGNGRQINVVLHWFDELKREQGK